MKIVVWCFVFLIALVVSPPLFFLLLICLLIWMLIKKTAKTETPIRLKTYQTNTGDVPPIVTPKVVSVNTSNDGLNWAGLGGSLSVSSYQINDPHVYWTQNNKSIARSEASCIILSATVSSSTLLVIEPLGYWPTYHAASPTQKDYYLKWLSSGKNGPLQEIGYAFIYFYGLEHRALIEQKDISLIIEETLRLLETYTFSGSFNSYLSNFIGYLVARENTQGRKLDAQSILGRLPSTNNELLLEAQLLSRLGNSLILSADLAYEAAALDPRASNSVVVKRVNEQFRQLFEKKYTDKFESGIQLAFKGEREFKYHPASPTLLYQMQSWPSIKIPNLLANKKQFTPLVQIWNECIEELRSLSRVAQKGINLTSREAFSALPNELKEEFEHPDKLTWDALLEEYIREDGLVILPISRLVSLNYPQLIGKLTLKQSKDLAKHTNDLGLSIVPDAREVSKAYSNEDMIALIKNESATTTLKSLSTAAAENVDLLLEKASHSSFKGRYELLPNNIHILISLKEELLQRKKVTNEDQAQRSSLNKLIFAIDKKLGGTQSNENFELAFVMMELGMIMALADKSVVDEEMRYISDFLESQFRFNGLEQRKLEAYREILRIQPPSISAVIKKLKNSLTLSQIELLLQFLVGIAAADKIIHQKEKSALTKIYTAFGIDLCKLETLLSNLQLEEDSPVQVKRGIPQLPGEAIPPEEIAEKEVKVKLNEEYLRQILDETSKVTAILADALKETAEKEYNEENSITQPSGYLEKEHLTHIPLSKEVLFALEQKYHQVLSELITFDEMGQQEFVTLARKHRLMPESMLDALNAWADEHLGDFLIEEGIPIKVNKHLVMEKP